MTNRDLDNILGPTGYEVSCEECFELLDQYVELELKNADAGYDPDRTGGAT